MNSETIQTAVTVIAVAIALALTGAVIGVARQVLVETKARATQAQWKLLDDLARAGVAFAEQSGITSAIKIAGEEKKVMAINFVQSYLQRFGISIDVRLIADHVEAAVWDEIASIAPLELVAEVQAPSPAPSKSRFLRADN